MDATTPAQWEFKTARFTYLHYPCRYPLKRILALSDILLVGSCICNVYKLIDTALLFSNIQTYSLRVLLSRHKGVFVPS